MKKIITILVFLLLSTGFIFSQSDDDFFGSEEDLFGSDDEFFLDDGIVEFTDTSEDDNLSKGILFEAGAVTVGGRLKAGINTNTVLYDPEKTDFGQNVKDTKLTPTLSALLTVDARPTETLRMYTKFGMEYPFVVRAGTTLWGTTNKEIQLPNGTKIPAGSKVPVEMGSPATLAQTTIADWFTLKELFTDFSIADRAFFRFGLHTVSWGTGYFFSPVSDMINTSAIDPENPTEQVNGSLNLRTQVVFPGTQNCLWAYVIPSTNFQSGSAEAYARDTGLAAKFDFVVGGWELGSGVYWKYENPLKLMATASGSIKKLTVFGEFVYQYGDETEWAKQKDWEDKTNIFQATVGGMYSWKDPGIMLAVQYYYDSNEVNLLKKITTNGHNIALMANFSKFGSVKELSASIFGMVNFGRVGLSESDKAMAEGFGIKSDLKLPVLTVNANLIYRPIDDISLSIGPSMTFTDFEKKPTVSLKIGATLGGGKF